MVARAGSALNARISLRRMRELYRETDVRSIESLLGVIDSALDAQPSDLSLIALAANAEGWRILSYGDVDRFDLPGGDAGAASGTGSDALRDALDSVTSFAVESSDAFNRTVGILINAGARMWALDTTGIGPQLAFGGATSLRSKRIAPSRNLMTCCMSFTITTPVAPSG